MASNALHSEGYRDDCTADVQGNRGNFLALIDYAIRSGDTALGTHLNVAARNAIYIRARLLKTSLLNALVSISGIRYFRI